MCHKLLSVSRVVVGLAGTALVGSLFLAGSASALDMRSAKAWLDDIPPLPATGAAADRVCPQITAKKEAVQTAYNQQSDALDAQDSDLDQDMGSAQAMAMLMQGGGVAEIEKFANAQLQMVSGEQSVELTALYRGKESTKNRLDQLRKKRRTDMNGCAEKQEECGNFGEGMSAADIACWDRRDAQLKKCQAEATNTYLQAAQAALDDWQGDLRIYLDSRESFLQKQEASHKNDYMRSQWKRQRVELLDLTTDYAHLAENVCEEVD